MNKRKIIIILSIICVIILCIVGSKLIHKKTENEVVDVSVKATSDRIDSEKYNIINGNIYYIYNEDAEFYISNYYSELFNKISDYLKKNYGDVKILFNGLDRKEVVDESISENEENKYTYIIDINQIQDGIVLINNNYRIIVDSNEEIAINGLENNPFMQEKINQSQLLKSSDVIKIVTNEINAHQDEMKLESTEDLIGTERIEYDGTNIYYYYKFGDLYIKINALNGEIIDEDLFNSRYFIQ